MSRTPTDRVQHDGIEAIRERVERKIAKATERGHGMTFSIPDARALLSLVDRLSAALWKYGTHATGCASLTEDPDDGCDCGLSELRGAFSGDASHVL